MYKPGNKDIWKGRMDPGSIKDLWHQVIEIADLNTQVPAGISFLGFASDIGVKRNMGRVGAVNGPDAIRKAMVNLALHFEDTSLTDAGDVIISGDQLENAQIELARYVSALIETGAFPIILGGGHEVSYAHGKGVMDTFKDQKIGMINFDPHFDLRTYPQGAHSGSWARQLFEEHENFHYLPIGINEAVNISTMFDLMREKEQSFITMDELLSEESQEELLARIEHFMHQMDHICVTLDLDVFSAGIAPGVSAVNPYGALPHHIKPLMKAIIKSEKTVSFDLAEMNPSYDDGRTAKLAASFIYDAVMTRLQ